MQDRNGRSREKVSPDIRTIALTVKIHTRAHVTTRAQNGSSAEPSGATRFRRKSREGQRI